MDFMTTKEATEKWKISERRIRKLLKDGRIIGAIKVGNSWSIPTNATKPIDKRSIKYEDKKIIINLSQIFFAKVDNLKDQIKKNAKYADEQFLIEWIYNDSKLERNTLTKDEIKIVINNITVGGKSIEEHLEIINYKNAIKYLINSVDKNIKITENEIKTIHHIVSQNIDNENTNTYRTEQENNDIDPTLIPEIMLKLISNYNEKTSHVIIKAVILHSELIKLSPFKDNNLKTALLLMNLIFMNNGYQPIIIKEEYKSNYLSQLKNSQITGDYTKLIKLILKIEEQCLEDEINKMEVGDK